METYMVCSLTVGALGFLFSTLHLPVATGLAACASARNLPLPPRRRRRLALRRGRSTGRGTTRGPIAAHPTHLQAGAVDSDVRKG